MATCSVWRLAPLVGALGFVFACSSGSGGQSTETGDASGDAAQGASDTNGNSGADAPGAGTDGIGGLDAGLQNDGEGSADGSNLDGRSPDAVDSCRVAPDKIDYLHPDIFLLLDRSTAGAELQPIKTALDRVATQLAGKARFGVARFAGTSGVCGAPTRLLELGNYSAVELQSSWAPITSGGSTPTALAIGTVRSNNWISDAADPSDATRDKALLLITDSGPDCGPGGRDDTTGQRVASRDSAAALAADGTAVFVVGVGAAADTASWDAIARAGGTDAPPAGAPYYYAAANTAAVETAVGSIIRGLMPCTFSLGTTLPPVDEIYVNLNGADLARGDPNGFTYNRGRNQITLAGLACAGVRTTVNPALAVSFGCAQN